VTVEPVVANVQVSVAPALPLDPLGVAHWLAVALENVDPPLVLYHHDHE
jgi:hypothetical protein